MDASDLRPRWVKPASRIFSVLVLVLVGGGLALGVRWALTDDGPTKEQVFFGETLPRWWIARARAEPPDVDIWAELPHPALEAPLRRLDALFREPRGLAAEAVALNQALERAELPFWIDVVIRGELPLILTFQVASRDRWQVGEHAEDVLHVTRLDRTNVTTGFTSRKGRGLPVVLLDVLERSILRELRDEAGASAAERLRADFVASYAAGAAGAGALDEARVELLERDRLVAQMARRRDGVRVTRPERFRFPPAWYADLERLTEHGEGPTLVFSADLRGVAAADEALAEGPSGQALRALRALWASVGSAHQAHLALAPEPAEGAPLPAPLAAYYDGVNPDIRRGAYLHYVATLGALRDAPAPPCAVLLRALGAAAGPPVRFTAFHYGSMAALHAVLETDALDAETLAAEVGERCAADAAEVRALAEAPLSALGVEAGRRSAGPVTE
jgi:hypothetical protein